MSDVIGSADLTCERVVEIITDYIEGTLDPAACRAVEDHLALCPGCERYLDQMRTTIDALGHLPEETLDQQARQTLLEAFRSRAGGQTGTQGPGPGAT